MRLSEGLFREFRENPYPFRPSEGRLHEQDFNAQIGNDHERAPGEKVGKGGFKTVEQVSDLLFGQ